MKSSKAKNNEAGFAMMESVVFMVVFVILAAYSIDLFTIIHSGILGSSAARTYLFETLEHRSNIDMLRFSDPRSAIPKNFQTKHFRLHAVNDEDQTDTDPVGAKTVGRTLTNAEDVGHQVYDNNINSPTNNTQTKTVYIKSAYGICLDGTCK